MIGKKLSRPWTRSSRSWPSDELTGRHLVVLGKIELVQVLVHRVAQVVLDVQRDPAPR